MAHYDQFRELQIEKDQVDTALGHLLEIGAEDVKKALLIALHDLKRQYQAEEAYNNCNNDDDDLYSFNEIEFLDFLEVLQLGAKKYARDNWLLPDGKRSSHKEMHDSMFHHLAESFAGVTKDKESGLHPLLHLASRSLMSYCRQVRGIIHPNDKNIK